MAKKFVIGMLVSNHFGVLTRVSAMFSRRGFNIDSLTVGVTELPEYSRMTVTMTGDNYARDQIIKQLQKIEDVKEIKELKHAQSVMRELIILKVAATSENRKDILETANVFKAKIIDFSPDSICIEITGECSKLDAFIELMKPYGIIEMCRTGTVAMDRGITSLKDEI